MSGTRRDEFRSSLWVLPISRQHALPFQTFQKIRCDYPRRTTQTDRSLSSEGAKPDPKDAQVRKERASVASGWPVIVMVSPGSYAIIVNRWRHLSGKRSGKIGGCWRIDHPFNGAVVYARSQKRRVQPSAPNSAVSILLKSLFLFGIEREKRKTFNRKRKIMTWPSARKRESLPLPVNFFFKNFLG